MYTQDLSLYVLKIQDIFLAYGWVIGCGSNDIFDIIGYYLMIINDALGTLVLNEYSKRRLEDLASKLYSVYEEQF